MIYPVVGELAVDGVPVATACRVLGVSTSGFYGRRPPDQPEGALEPRVGRRRPHDPRRLARHLRGTYGAPRVHAELRLGAPEMAVGRATAWMSRSTVQRATGCPSGPVTPSRRSWCHSLRAP